MASTKENIKDLVENFESNPTSTGGVYFSDGVMHVVPLEKSSESEVMLLNNNIEKCNVSENNIKIVIDEPKTYSLKELNDAYKCLNDDLDNLDIVGFGTSIKNNGIEVYASYWDDEKEEKIKNLIN